MSNLGSRNPKGGWQGRFLPFWFSEMKITYLIQFFVFFLAIYGGDSISIILAEKNFFVSESAISAEKIALLLKSAILAHLWSAPPLLFFQKKFFSTLIIFSQWIKCKRFRINLLYVLWSYKAQVICFWAKIDDFKKSKFSYIYTKTSLNSIFSFFCYLF